MGKVLLSFLFFLASSTVALREARPRPTPPVSAPVVVDEPEPPARVVEPPPWVKYAPPPTPPAPPPTRAIVQPPPSAAPMIADVETEGDVADVEDRCPDQPEEIEGKRDDDGCPERLVEEPAQRVVQLDTIFY